MSSDAQTPPLPEKPAPLVRGVTVCGLTTRKPCIICRQQASFYNIDGCTRYSDGKMLCSEDCREKYVTQNGSLPSH